RHDRAVRINHSLGGAGRPTSYLCDLPIADPKIGTVARDPRTIDYSSALYLEIELSHGSLLNDRLGLPQFIAFQCGGEKRDLFNHVEVTAREVVQPRNGIRALAGPTLPKPRPWFCW